MTYRVSTNWWRIESISKAIDPEVVSTQDNLLESLVIEEHVECRGVCLLSRMVGLVLHATIGLLLETRVGLWGAEAGDKVCASNKPGKIDIVTKSFNSNKAVRLRHILNFQNSFIFQNWI